MMRRAYVGRFVTAEELQRAARAALADGLLVEEIFSPHALPDAFVPAKTAGKARRIPAIAAAAGVLGALAAGEFQYFADRRDWPLDIGGTFGGSAPSWLPVAFLVGCLCAAIVALVAFVVRGSASGHSVRADGDYVLALSLESPGFDWRTARAWLLAHGAREAGYAEVHE
ncbi:MAG: quinol:electron acceptor oxidoreductase subunit ActD [Myxococcales bacterium]|jgi:hypothetical protein